MALSGGASVLTRGTTSASHTGAVKAEQGAPPSSVGAPPTLSFLLGSVRKASDLFKLPSLGRLQFLNLEDLTTPYCELNWSLGVEEYGHNRFLKDPVMSRLHMIIL